MNAENGNIITTLPTGVGVDTVAFNPATMEAISAENGGSMTFIKENSPTSFAVEQTLQTMPGAKTLALDTKTNHVLTMTAEFGPRSAQRAARTGRTPCPWSHGTGFVFNSDGGQVEVAPSSACCIQGNDSERSSISRGVNRACTNQLRLLGFYPKRDSQGYGVLLSEDLSRQIHCLARDYQLAAAERALTSCPHCAEIMAAA